MGIETTATFPDGGNGGGLMPTLSLDQLRVLLSPLWGNDEERATLREDLPPLLYDLLTDTSLDGFYGKTYRACYLSTMDGYSDGCCVNFRNSGMGWGTKFLTLNTSESPNAAVECFLGTVL